MIKELSRKTVLLILVFGASGWIIGCFHSRARKIEKSIDTMKTLASNWLPSDDRTIKEQPLFDAWNNPIVVSIENEKLVLSVDVPPFAWKSGTIVLTCIKKPGVQSMTVISSGRCIESRCWFYEQFCQ